MADIGFEMLIYSFGSGFDLESEDPAYLNTVRDTVDYARSLGIEVGGYDLIALTRKVRPDWMAVNSETNGTWPSACFASGWYDELLEKTLKFLDYTGLTMVETDGRLQLLLQLPPTSQGAGGLGLPAGQAPGGVLPGPEEQGDLHQPAGHLLSPGGQQGRDGIR